MVLPGGISINPINWKRDETYAPASENKGSLRPNKETGEYEIQHPFFYDNIKDNVAKRIATYKANHECLYRPNEHLPSLFAYCWQVPRACLDLPRVC